MRFTLPYPTHKHQPPKGSSLQAHNLSDRLNPPKGDVGSPDGVLVFVQSRNTTSHPLQTPVLPEAGRPFRLGLFHKFWGKHNRHPWETEPLWGWKGSEVDNLQVWDNGWERQREVVQSTPEPSTKCPRRITQPPARRCWRVSSSPRRAARRAPWCWRRRSCGGRFWRPDPLTCRVHFAKGC